VQFAVRTPYWRFLTHFRRDFDRVFRRLFGKLISAKRAWIFDDPKSTLCRG